MNKQFAQEYFDKNRPAIMEEWFDFLRIPTVGTDPKRLGDCARGAAWLKKFLRPLGFDVEILTPPSGRPVPVLFAERLGEKSDMNVLFYGHYDVQPEDPLNEWKTPPFEPTLIDGRVYARGAQDNKGQVFGFLHGIKALIEAGKPLPTLKVLIEGQEESGSEALSLLAPEMVAPNPAQGMAHLLASLHNPDGSIAVAGFNDRISLPSAEEHDHAMKGAISNEQYEKEVGCPPAGGQENMDMVMRGSFMPTIEINGIHTGYGGPGSKTVIPATALAKISMRLVPGQVPAETYAAVQKHLESHCPRGMKVALSEACRGAPGFRLPLKSPIFRLAADVLGQMDPRGALFRWEGASIPIVATLQAVSGAAPLLVGFGREEDKIHCPNESFGVEQLVECMTWSSMMVQALAE
jgi:acetylornithine deacetylase/succinyl-diaminopimelate desuccinylase-like protein